MLASQHGALVEGDLPPLYQDPLPFRNVVSTDIPKSACFSRILKNSCFTFAMLSIQSVSTSRYTTCRCQGSHCHRIKLPPVKFPGVVNKMRNPATPSI